MVYRVSGRQTERDSQKSRGNCDGVKKMFAAYSSHRTFAVRTSTCKDLADSWCLLQCVAIVLQCGAMWCSKVLQCVAVCCSVLPRAPACYSVLQRVTMCGSVVQWCSVR